MKHTGCGVTQLIQTMGHELKMRVAKLRSGV